MSKRLQVLLDEAEFRAIRRIARREGKTVAEWVRQALRAARVSEPTGDVHKKLAALRKAMTYQFPVADIDQMNAEIEQGYLSDPSLDDLR